MIQITIRTNGSMPLNLDLVYLANFLIKENDILIRGALYKKLRFVNVRNVGTNLGVGTFTWIFMV